VPGNYTGDWAETRDRIDREVREELGMKSVSVVSK